jgi:hypothetical protein
MTEAGISFRQTRLHEAEGWAAAVYTGQVEGSRSAADAGHSSSED